MTAGCLASAPCLTLYNEDPGYLIQPGPGTFKGRSGKESDEEGIRGDNRCGHADDGAVRLRLWIVFIAFIIACPITLSILNPIIASAIRFKSSGNVQRRIEGGTNDLQ